MKLLLPSFAKKYDRNCLVILLLVVAGFALYSGTFQNQMFWDDNDSILNNQFIQNWQYIPQYFSENLIAGANFLSNYWRPALLSVFSLEWHLWGDWAPGYHFVNTSFHIADASLLFFILLYIFRNRLLAALASIVFLVHPLQTEAVTYVSGLGDSLSVFFIFLGILFYLKFRVSGVSQYKSWHYGLSLLMYVFALMSKETAIIMPALIFIAGFFSPENGEPLPLKQKLLREWQAIWPFLAVAGAYILLRATALNFINTFNLYNEENVFTSHLYVRLLTFFRTLTVYFGLMFWPVGLHMERSVEMATSIYSFSVISGALIFSSLIALAIALYKRLAVVSFGILWFFIAISPMSNIAVPINGLLYEHWLYMPMTGIFLGVIWTGIRIAEKYNLQKVFFGIFVLFLAFLCIQTWNRNRDWRDPITLYTQTLLYSPNSYRVINNLGMAYADGNNYEQAENTYRRAIGVEPSGPVAYHNLGNLYLAQSKIDVAIENYNVAITLDPRFTPSYNALAGLYLEKKNYKEARKVLEDYAARTNAKIGTLLVLIRIALEEKDLKAASSYLEKAAIIDPNNQLIRAYRQNIRDMTLF